MNVFLISSSRSLFIRLVLYLEVIQSGFVFVLRSETGVGQVAAGLPPILDASVVV